MTTARKWRPGLWMVVAAVLGLVLLLPFAGLFLFRFYANQLVQQTEESLLTQAAVLTAAYEQLYRNATGLPEDPIAWDPDDRVYTPLFPSVTMNPEAILPARPDPTPATEDIAQAYRQIGPHLTRIAIASQEQTLAGYRFLDRHGTVIAGSAEQGLYLGHVGEIALALNGEVVSVARTRLRESATPIVYALSQGTAVRVFVAMPAMVGEDIIGVVYISRTPNHIFRFLYGERLNLAKALVFILGSTALIGFVFWRFVTQPMRALINRTDAIRGSEAWQPLEHYGTREVENLARSFQSLTERLQRQQDTLRTYTAHVSHELKSPLTAIKGAAELLRDADMTPERRARFLDNIVRDSDRMEDLLATMRDFSLVEQTAGAGVAQVAQVLEDLPVEGLGVTVAPPHAEVPMRPEALRIVLKHLLENAAEHGASEVSITVDGSGFIVADDGNGISAGNHDKVLQPFFTTRRENGGTGMGLNIVQSVLAASGARLDVLSPHEGAAFQIAF
ncbi:histidine kinase dimerization/phospho-acceptor domain-containing protein [Gymnodinialimonas sp. 2305UL16-5]|uniref:histidine kinase dimerization/phospho-acceptor domain-containing protein n=1 Tax=Gymnodinialimonas mytili TaxID=3126503 RepID=UPI0030AC0A19